MSSRGRKVITDMFLVGMVLVVAGTAVVIGRSVLGRGASVATGSPALTALPAPTAFKPTPTEPLPPAAPKPNETGVPTPWPTIVFPPMTPVPTARNAIEAGMQDRITPTPPPPLPTPKASDPYHMKINGARLPLPERITKEATVVAIGAVKQILPARWTTPDGKRPANPHAPPYQTIYRPVVLEVQQYLKGPQPQPQLLLWVLGGTVGQDSVEYQVDDLFTFREGDRVVVYLVSEGRTLNTSPLLTPRDRYTVTKDGRAGNGYRNLSLRQLIDEIRRADGR